MNNRKAKNYDLTPPNSRPDTVYHCGVCNEQYVDCTDIEERWIGCESCDSWFHFTYMGINDNNIPANFFCEDCVFQ